MKLIEKLAKECSLNREDEIRLGTITIPSKEFGANITARYSINLRYEIISAYESGFRKAREMACNALYDAGTDPTGYGEDQIRSIGESEVE